MFNFRHSTRPIFLNVRWRVLRQNLPLKHASYHFDNAASKFGSLSKTSNGAREREKKRRIVQDGVCRVRDSELHETVRERYLFQIVPTTFSDRRLDSPRFEEATHLQRWESFQAGENQWFLTQFDRRTAGFQYSLLRKQPGEQPSFLLRKSVGNLFLFPLFQYQAASAPPLLCFLPLFLLPHTLLAPFPIPSTKGETYGLPRCLCFGERGSREAPVFAASSPRYRSHTTFGKPFPARNLRKRKSNALVPPPRFCVLMVCFCPSPLDSSMFGTLTHVPSFSGSVGV